MNDAAFDDDRKPKKKGSSNDLVSTIDSMSLDGKRRVGSDSHPNALKDEDLDEFVEGGSGFISGSRSNVIQQQRDLQKKKLQERMGGGVVRTSLPRQYSAPRPTDIDDKPS